jgi:hypothetical protein
MNLLSLKFIEYLRGSKSNYLEANGRLIIVKNVIA